MDSVTKVCRVCNKDESETEFYENQQGNRICKVCLSLYYKERNRQKAIERDRENGITYDPSQTKVCILCGKEKPATPEFFRRSPDGESWVGAKCLECKPTDLKEYHRAYNRSGSRKRNSKRSDHKRRIENPIGYVLRRAKATAKKRGLTFDLDQDYLEELFRQQKGKCYWFGIDLLNAEIKDPQAMSIDRIDSDEGYVKGNVALCCQGANYSKNDSSPERFRKFLELISECLPKWIALLKRA